MLGGFVGSWRQYNGSRPKQSCSNASKDLERRVRIFPSECCDDAYIRVSGDLVSGSGYQRIMMTLSKVVAIFERLERRSRIGCWLSSDC